MGSISTLPAYSSLLQTKLEANIMVDTIYGESGTGFSAKIQFDHDPAYGTNDTNGLTMIDISSWPSVRKNDDFFCDCTDIQSNCVCCAVERYFENYCSYFKDDPAETDKEFRFVH